jgi:hypothetical protein
LAKRDFVRGPVAALGLVGLLGLIPCSSFAVDEPSVGVDNPNYAAPLDAPVNNNVSPSGPPKPYSSGNGSGDSPVYSKDNIVTPVTPERSRYPELVDAQYVAHLSQWAFQLSGSPSALGGNTITSGPKTRGVGMNLEFQPQAFQWKFGTVSFGPQLFDYPFVTGTSNAPALIPVWSIGADVRYKMLFTAHQIIVPMMGYSYEHVSYHLADAGDGSLSLAGPIAGGYILLNEIDNLNGGSLYVATGITRVYLVAEARILYGSDSNLSLSGTSFYFGLRLEY